MKFDVNIKLKQQQLNKIEEAAQTSLALTAFDLYSDVLKSEVMPYDTGNMQNQYTRVVMSDDKNMASLITKTPEGMYPYPVRVYYHPEFNFQTIHNRNAQAFWYADYLSGGQKKNFCRQRFAKNFRGEMK